MERSNFGSDQEAGWGVSATWLGFQMNPQPLWGCELITVLPKVARSSQPWALLRNPFGILAGSELLGR
jgi:hypothetical protein